MRNAADVVQADLEYMHAALREEWPALAGRRLLITGGAGFLGYYFTHAAVHFNRSAPQDQRIEITVYDNLARGAPAWLEQLRAAGELELQTHDMSQPLPSGFGPFDYIIHAASIASPTYYRAASRSRRWTRTSTACATCSTTRRQQQGSATPVRGLPVLAPAARSMATRIRPRSRRPRPIAASCRAPARAPATTRPSATARPCAWSSPGSTACRSGLRVRSTTTARG